MKVSRLKLKVIKALDRGCTLTTTSYELGCDLIRARYMVLGDHLYPFCQPSMRTIDSMVKQGLLVGQTVTRIFSEGGVRLYRPMNETTYRLTDKGRAFLEESNA